MDDESTLGRNGPYVYAGPAELRSPIETALRRVNDPELASAWPAFAWVGAATMAASAIIWRLKHSSKS